MTRVPEVTATDFGREVLFSAVPVVVDVYADWCAPCRAIAPVLEKLAAQYAGELKFVKVNLDTEPEVAAVYGVEAVPTLLFFRGGQLIDRVVGLPPAREMWAKLDALAGRAGSQVPRSGRM